MKLFSVNHNTNSHQAAFAEQVDVAEDPHMPAVPVMVLAFAEFTSRRRDKKDDISDVLNSRYLRNLFSEKHMQWIKNNWQCKIIDINTKS